MQAGDKILIATVGNLLPASIVTVHDSGAVDAKIEQEGHPANGAVTHVAAGNFRSATTEEIEPLKAAPIPSFPTASHQQSKVERLGQYTTVTRR